MGENFAGISHLTFYGAVLLGNFYGAVLLGNIAQWLHHRSAFVLDIDAKRFWRLFAQSFLMGSARWSMGASDELQRHRLGDDTSSA